MHETIQVILSDPGEHQMKPFSKLEVHNDLFATSNDGRLFQINQSDYSIKRKFSLHNSWISSLMISNDFLITTSYDASISLFKTNDLLSSENPIFINKRIYNDYILCGSLFERNIITASSEPSMRVSTISQAADSINQDQLINVSVSCHSLFSDSSKSCIHCGFCDGTYAPLDIREHKTRLTGSLIYDSCIKAIKSNNDQICIGFLDGTVSLRDSRDITKEIKKYKGDSRVLSIQNENDGFLIFFYNGTVINTKSDKEEATEIIKEKCTSCFKDQNGVFHVCDDKGVLHKIDKGEEKAKLEPSPAIKKIGRLSHSTDILMKNTNHQVLLMDGSTFQIKFDFGKGSFKSKLREMSERPSLYFPVSFDITTGIPKVIISNFLPKIVDAKFVQERKCLKAFAEGIIAKKLKVVCINSSNIPQWTSTANEMLPQWMRYAIDPMLPYK